MRISTEYQFSLYTAGVDSAQQKLVTAQQQEITGLRINSASDDPEGTIQLLNMSQVQSRLNQYQTNLTNAGNNLSLTDNALNTAGNLMQSAYQVALQATSGTNSPATMQNYAQQIQQIQQQLVAVANQQNASGEYLFAGQRTNAQPFTVSGGQLTYSGDGNSISVPVGPGSNITSNVPGTPLFTDAYNALQALQTDLQSGNTPAISSTDIQTLQNSQQTITNTRGTVGARSDEVANLTSDNNRRITELTTQISGDQNVDVAQATTNYAQAESAYQAALSVVSRAASLSLSSFINSSTA